MSLAITIDNTKHPVAAAQIDSAAEKFSIHSSRNTVTDEDKALCFVRVSLNVPHIDRNHDQYGVAAILSPQVKSVADVKVIERQRLLADG